MMKSSDNQSREMSLQELKAASRVLQALSHPLRLGIIQMLSQGELPFGDLLERLECSQSLLSQQLRILEEQRLIQMRRDGRLKYCSIQNHDFIQVFHCMTKHLETYFKVEKAK